MVIRGLLFLFLSGWTAMWFLGAGQWSQLECSEASQRCTYTRGSLFVVTVLTLTREADEFLDVKYGFGNKRAGVGGRVLVEFSEGRPWDVDYPEEGSARERVATLNAHLARGTLPTFKDTHRNGLPLLCPTFMFGLFSLLMLGSTLRAVWRESQKARPEKIWPSLADELGLTYHQDRIHGTFDGVPVTIFLEVSQEGDVRTHVMTRITPLLPGGIQINHVDHLTRGTQWLLNERVDISTGDDAFDSELSVKIQDQNEESLLDRDLFPGPDKLFINETAPVLKLLNSEVRQAFINYVRLTRQCDFKSFRILYVHEGVMRDEAHLKAVLKAQRELVLALQRARR